MATHLEGVLALLSFSCKRFEDVLPGSCREGADEFGFSGATWTVCVARSFGPRDISRLGISMYGLSAFNLSEPYWVVNSLLLSSFPSQRMNCPSFLGEPQIEYAVVLVFCLKGLR